MKFLPCHSDILCHSRLLCYSCEGGNPLTNYWIDSHFRENDRGSQGFILLAVIVFMQVFALLGITALEEVFWQEKLISKQRAEHSRMNSLERIFKHIESEADFSQSRCLVSRISEAEWRNRSWQWWKEQACMDQSSYYALEYLGQDPCAAIRNSQAEPAYYRISVLIMNQEAAGRLFQTTVVQAAKTQGHCEQERHSVDLGQQSWREI